MEQDLPVGLLHLLKGMLSVKWRDWDVATVDNAKVARGEGVQAVDRVVGAAFLLARRGRPDAPWTEAGARPIGGRSVVGKPQNGDVEGDVMGLCQAALPR